MNVILFLLPELRQIVWWLLGAVIVAILLMAPMIAYFVQPWAPWWLQGNTQAPPGDVPPAAKLQPQGPLLGEALRCVPQPNGECEQTNVAVFNAIAKWVGVPYVFGGCSLRGVDCSCMVQLVFAVLGHTLPRTAQQQYYATAPIDTPDVGDLVFFERTYSSSDRITHVGIYLGSGWMFSAIEPAAGRQSLSSPYWSSHFAGWGRIRR